MTTQEQVVFFVVDDSTNDLFTLLNEAPRYGTGAAALAHRKPGESIWRCTGAQVTENP